MHWRACQGVPFTAIMGTLILGGCFGSHDPPGERPRPDAMVTTDGGTTDAATLDASLPPPMCPAHVPDRVCVLEDTGAVPPGVPYSLPIAVEGCYCSETFTCAAAITAPNVLSLSIGLCPSLADCDGCVPTIEGRCELPPLTEGNWRVLVNGAPSFDLPVAVPTPGFVARPVCFVPAPPPEPAYDCEWPGTFFTAPATVCHPAAAPAGQSVTIRVAHECAECFDVAGACTVAIEADRIVVQPTERQCGCATCGACPDVCFRLETTCRTPPLSPGRYQVDVLGLPGGGGATIEVTADGTMGGEICGSSSP